MRARMFGAVGRAAAAAGIVGIATVLAPSAARATGVQCGGAATCSSPFTLYVNDLDVGGGQLLYDAEKGTISLDTMNFRGNAVPNGTGGLYWNAGDTHVTVTGLSGNADPNLIFGIGATTTTNAATFSFSFSLPVSLSGPIHATSGIQYTLTGGGPVARMTPVSLDGNALHAYEVDTDGSGAPLPSVLDKGVGAGAMFQLASSPGGPTASPSYSASNTFTGNTAYDLMSVVISFALTAQTGVGMSGFVRQDVVPLPAALPLLLSGLAGLVVSIRRRVAR